MNLYPDTKETYSIYSSNLTTSSGLEDPGTQVPQFKLPLFFKCDDIIKSKDTKLIDFGVFCEYKEYSTTLRTKGTNSPLPLFTNRPFFVIPKTSIYKTGITAAINTSVFGPSKDRIIIPLSNYTDFDIKIKKGDSLFQVVLPSLNTFDIVIVEPN